MFPPIDISPESKSNNNVCSCRKGRQPHVFRMQGTSTQEGESKYDVELANFELRLPPDVIFLAKGVIYIKECLMHNYECIFCNSKTIQTKPGSISISVYLEHAKFFLLSRNNQPFRSIKMTLLNSKMEYRQSCLVSGRTWLNENLHIDMDNELAVSIDEVSIFLTGMVF